MPEQPTHTFFNSRCAEYKTPFGAVPAGQTVTWRLTVPERLGYVDPHLVLTKDREDPDPAGESLKGNASAYENDVKNFK